MLICSGPQWNCYRPAITARFGTRLSANRVLSRTTLTANRPTFAATSSKRLPFLCTDVFSPPFGAWASTLNSLVSRFNHPFNQMVIPGFLGLIWTVIVWFYDSIGFIRNLLYLQLMWVQPTVCGLAARNVGRIADNVAWALPCLQTMWSQNYPCLRAGVNLIVGR